MKRVFVAGHKGMVGSAIVRQLSKDSSVEVITKDRNELNLLDALAVETFLRLTILIKFTLRPRKLVELLLTIRTLLSLSTKI